jgi:hypothetical protein
VRVDPRARPLPRLPAVPKLEPYPMILSIPGDVRTMDSATFATDAGRFRLANIERTPPNEICIEPTGKRWSCGLRRRMALRAKIAGRTFRCRALAVAAGETTLECLDGLSPLDIADDPPRQ